MWVWVVENVTELVVFHTKMYIPTAKDYLLTDIASMYYQYNHTFSVSIKTILSISISYDVTVEWSLTWHLLIETSPKYFWISTNYTIVNSSKIFLFINWAAQLGTDYDK